MKFQSTKLFDGYSTAFRQWRAEDSHCRFLHGYAISFRVTFEGGLDERNWVFDFGGFKRAKNDIDGLAPKAWLDNLLDHTTIIAEDDPHLESFKTLDEAGIIQLRILPHTGAERFAEYLYNKLNVFITNETHSKIHIAKIEVFENNKNSAVYEAL